MYNINFIYINQCFSIIYIAKNLNINNCFFIFVLEFYDSYNRGI